MVPKFFFLSHSFFEDWSIQPVTLATGLICAILTNKYEITLFQLFVMQMLNALLPKLVSCMFFLSIVHALLTHSDKHRNMDYGFLATEIHIQFFIEHCKKANHLWYTPISSSFKYTQIFRSVQNHVANSKCLIFYFTFFGLYSKMTPKLIRLVHINWMLDL